MYQKNLLFIFFLLFSTSIWAQTPGLIYVPQGGMGVTPLNPNGDGWSSVSTTGYVTNDLTESEIIYRALPAANSEPTSDLVRGADCFFSDIVRIDAYDSGVYMTTDATNMYIRFRQGGTVPGSKGYSLLIDTDQKFGGSGPNADPNYIPKTTGINGNPGFELEVILETNFRVAIYNVDGRDGFTGGAPVLMFSYPIGTHHQRSVALTNRCDNPDYFHDFYVNLADLYAAGGINSSTPLRFAATTVMAPKPAIGGPISDINGGASYEEVILYQCATPIGPPGGPAFCGNCTNPPSLNGPLSPISTSVTGSWTPLNGTKPNNCTINIYINGTLSSSGPAVGGAGWSQPISGLVNGDVITAIAVAPGEVGCLVAEPIIVSTCTPSNTSRTPTVTCMTSRGAEGTGTPGDTITVFHVDATRILKVNTVTLTVSAAGIWEWNGPANGSGGCGGGSPDTPDGTYIFTARTPGNPCGSGASDPVCLTTGSNAATTTYGDYTTSTANPTITQNPIYTGATVISGTATASSTVRLYINRVLKSTQTATGGGTYSFTGLTLITGDTVLVMAQAPVQCAGTISRRVNCFVAPPTITANTSNQVAAGSPISGTSSLAAGTIVSIFDAGTGTLLGTASVQANGTWTSLINAVAGTTYRATQTIACGTSGNSNTVTGVTATSAARCGAFTNTPYNELTANITGTLTSAVAGTTVRLFLDGEEIGSVVTGTTTWSIAVNTGPSNRLYAGGVLSFSIQDGANLATLCSARSTILCNVPTAPIVTSTTNLTVYNAPGTASFDIQTTQLGVLYVIEDQAAPYIDRGVSKFGTGGPMTLSTYPYIQSGTYNLRIKAMTFNGLGCESFAVVSVTVPDAGPDGIPDYLDIDDDDDGIPDVVESCGLGATDFSCLPGGADPSQDADNDGIPNYRDPDFCVLNSKGVCAILDADGDGIINQYDLDSDNDGIPDIIESRGINQGGSGVIEAPSDYDVDGDGLNDRYDPVCNNTPAVCASFVPGPILGYGDRDGDGIPDFLDLDSDNDGIPDVVEAGGTDVDGDGRIDNFVDTDLDGFHDVVDGDVGNDGVAENTALVLIITNAGQPGNTGRPDGYPRGDRDADGVPNFMDLDSDNDGIPDVIEAGGTDANGDGRADNYVDTDNDGYNDRLDGDVGNDGVSENSARSLLKTGADGNNDGRPDTYPTGDFDGDGILNQYDLDADNDGIQDILEVGGVDINGDGKVDGYTDTDEDGWSQNVDGDINNDGVIDNIAGVLILTGIDADLDGKPDTYPFDNADRHGLPNFLDLDSDNDGITDVVENASGSTFGANRDAAVAGGVLDGQIGVGGITDGDANGWHDGKQGSTSMVDTDGDGVPDMYDQDSDNDGIPDFLEGTCSTCPNFSTTVPVPLTDANNNGILDAYENLTNTNANGGSNKGLVPNEDNDDGTLPPDYLDTDSDNDTALDWLEGFDTNGDGNAAPEIKAIAVAYVTNGGPAGHYPPLDSDSDGLPDWMDNMPNTMGYNPNIVAPFLNPLSPFWRDADNDGLVDLFDSNIDGNAWGTLAPVPDKDGVNDRDWRDASTSIDLPIDWLYFNADRRNSLMVDLNWATATEENNLGFEVERMLDNQINFKKVGFVNSKGNSTTTTLYSFADNNSYGGVSYYRLKQYDIDGTFNYSEIRAVAGDANQVAVSVYPNPTPSTVSVRFGSLPADATNATISIVDVLGRVVHKFERNINPFESFEISEAEQLVPGTYYVRFEFNSGLILSKEFIKKD